ncbi:hypothetical protein THAOC_12530, partial [Thalassiosira oceanica]
RIGYRLGSVDEGHVAKNFPDRRRLVIGSEGQPDLAYARGYRLHTLSEDAAARFDCRQLRPPFYDASAGPDMMRTTASVLRWPALKANRFPATSDHAGLQIARRGIRPRPSAISGAESGSKP